MYDQFLARQARSSLLIMFPLFRPLIGCLVVACWSPPGRRLLLASPHLPPRHETSEFATWHLAPPAALHPTFPLPCLPLPSPGDVRLCDVGPGRRRCRVWPGRATALPADHRAQARPPDGCLGLPAVLACAVQPAWPCRCATSRPSRSGEEADAGCSAVSGLLRCWRRCGCRLPGRGAAAPLLPCSWPQPPTPPNRFTPPRLPAAAARARASC